MKLTIRRAKLVRMTGMVALCYFVAYPNVAYADHLLKVWRTVYERVHPGVSPPFAGKEQAAAWAVQERDQVEPIVMDIIREHDPEVQWTAGLAIARHIPSSKVCALLVEQTRRVIDRAPFGKIESGSVDESGLCNMLDILTDQRHEAIRSIVLELSAKPGQSSLLIEHCLLALQKIGVREDVEHVRRIVSWRMNPHIDRLSALTEKVVAARAEGRDLLGGAEQELRVLTSAYLRAIEVKDAKGYIDLHHFGYRRSADERDVAEDVFLDPSMPDVIRSLRRNAGREVFEIDRDRLAAGCTLDGRYRLTYVFESDGWRIGTMGRIAP